MSKPGKDFELAVERFAKAINPTAKVIWNHKIPDRDTGTLRQCDVWIDTRVGGHYPLTVLISCKDWPETKLDIGHLSTFCEEVRATSANLGVIYSRAGFTEPALAKAKANGISCCRLYQDQPVDLPQSFPIWFYAAAPRLRLAVTSEPLPNHERATWADLFEAVPTLPSQLNEEFKKLEDRAPESMQRTRTFPEACWVGLELRSESLSSPMKFQLTCGWRRYRAKTEAVLVNGSYCFANQDFAGVVSGPVIDLHNTNLGPGWEEITTEEACEGETRVCMILRRGDMQEALQHIRKQPLWVGPSEEKGE